MSVVDLLEAVQIDDEQTHVTVRPAPGLQRSIDVVGEAGVVRLSEADRAGPLARRLNACKEVVRLDLVATSSNRVDDAIAEAVLERHATGTRTLIVLNRVDAAQRLHDRMLKRLAKVTAPPAVVLLHSRFRPVDRAVQMTAALAEPGAAGTIVVATQVIEAGVDVSCALLVTMTAPFSSMVQRLGRCNRAGELDVATVLWLDQGLPDAKGAAPYAPEDLADASASFADYVKEAGLGMSNQWSCPGPAGM
jgi:CRISPR-associated endonuclease/helicase Cas3